MDPSDRRIRRSWWTFSFAFVLVVVTALLRAIAPDATLADRVVLGVVVVAGLAAFVHWSAVADLDDFKLVNDTFGHLFGDRVLTWAAELIRATLRASDVPARYGGDEFAVILPDTDAPEARRAAERILEAFRDQPFVGEQRGPVPIAASIGAATFPADGRTATELIACADRRLYQVKRDGGHGRDAGPVSAGPEAHSEGPAQPAD